MFKQWKWEDTWLSVLVLAALVAVGFVAVIIVAPKVVDGYYVSQGQQKASSSCVFAHWTWHVDELAFCSDDYQKVLDFAAKANQLVKR
jgi:hypothetical protein